MKNPLKMSCRLFLQFRYTGSSNKPTDFQATPTDAQKLKGMFDLIRERTKTVKKVTPVADSEGEGSASGSGSECLKSTHDSTDHFPRLFGAERGLPQTKWQRFQNLLLAHAPSPQTSKATYDPAFYILQSLQLCLMF